MPKQVVMNYWIQEATDNTLDKMPAYVDIAALAFLNVKNDYSLDWTFLTKNFTVAQLKDAVKKVQARGTKVLISIRDDDHLGKIPSTSTTFINSMVAAINEWGFDGIDFDYEKEPNFAPSDTLVGLVKELRVQIRSQLRKEMIFTAPIFKVWTPFPDFMRQLGSVVDYISTMDYTPYESYDITVNLLHTYAKVIPWEKLLIGTSCMIVTDDRHTPLPDVKRLAEYNPSATQSKGGIMLWTWTYDVKTRTHVDDGTWTNTMKHNLK